MIQSYTYVERPEKPKSVTFRWVLLVAVCFDINNATLSGKVDGLSRQTTTSIETQTRTRMSTSIGIDLHMHIFIVLNHSNS